MSYHKPLSNMSYLKGRENSEAPSAAALALAQSLVREYDEHEKQQDLQFPQSVWYNMTQRAEREDLYVHPEWLESFESWLDHVGPRPDFRHNLIRVDLTLGYEPGNVTWSPITEGRA